MCWSLLKKNPAGSDPEKIAPDPQFWFLWIKCSKLYKTTRPLNSLLSLTDKLTNEITIITTLKNIIYSIL